MSRSRNFRWNYCLGYQLLLLLLPGIDTTNTYGGLRCAASGEGRVRGDGIGMPKEVRAGMGRVKYWRCLAV